MRTMQVVTSRRLLALAATAVALVSVTGCDQSTQTAATVGSQTISVHDITLMTQALCTEQATAPDASSRPPSALSSVNQSAVDALVRSAIDNQYAAANHLPYDKLQLAQEVGNLNALISQLPTSDQAHTKTLITDLFRGQMQVYNAAGALVQQSGKQATQQAVSAAAAQLEASYSKHLSISINPRYGSSLPGHGDGDQSVSIGVSSAAKDGQSAGSGQPNAQWVMGLPASQRCGQ